MLYTTRNLRVSTCADPAFDSLVSRARATWARSQQCLIEFIADAAAVYRYARDHNIQIEAPGRSLEVRVLRYVTADEHLDQSHWAAAIRHVGQKCETRDASIEFIKSRRGIEAIYKKVRKRQNKPRARKLTASEQQVRDGTTIAASPPDDGSPIAAAPSSELLENVWLRAQLAAAQDRLKEFEAIFDAPISTERREKPTQIKPSVLKCIERVLHPSTTGRDALETLKAFHRLAPGWTFEEMVEQRIDVELNAVRDEWYEDAAEVAKRDAKRWRAEADRWKAKFQELQERERSRRDPANNAANAQPEYHRRRRGPVSGEPDRSRRAS